MKQESTFETISSLQQQVDRIDDQIVGKRERISKNHYDGSIRRNIENEISDLLLKRQGITARILELKISINKPLKATT